MGSSEWKANLSGSLERLWRAGAESIQGDYPESVEAGSASPVSPVSEAG